MAPCWPHPRRVELAGLGVDEAELVVEDGKVADRILGEQVKGLLVGVGGGVEMGEQLSLGPAIVPGLFEPLVAHGAELVGHLVPNDQHQAQLRRRYPRLWTRYHESQVNSGTRR